MKKIRIVFLAVLLAAVAVIAAACSKDVKYYKLTFTKTDGVTYVSEIMSGADVMEGYEVRFSLQIDTERVEGTPVVKANGTEIKPDASGVYSFKMTADTVVDVSDVFVVMRYDVIFDPGITRSRFLDENGKELDTELSVIAGETVKFKVAKSVYFVGNERVLANTTVLKPDASGVYTVAVTEKVTVTVQDLVQEDPFYLRENGGRGTEANPYKLSRPVDFYTLTRLIADGFYTSLPYDYYELTADIDFGGEQLYIIGDATTETAFFAGHFNGNGHKISNFYIDDTFPVGDASVFLPYIGMFGYVTASPYGPAEIKNVTLENFEIHVDSSSFTGNSVVGGLVGLGNGVDISGCSVSGNITVKASESRSLETDNFYYTYAGGLIGIMQEYDDGGKIIPSAVRSCSSQTDVTVQSGNVMAAGGIAGYVISEGQKTPSYIVNSVSVGNISGAVRAGGIAGFTSSDVSVQNCLAVGDISAVANIRSGVSASADGYAYAGGLVGYTGCNSVVLNSAYCGKVSASAAEGAWFEYKSNAVAMLGTGPAVTINEVSAYTDNCRYVTDSAELGKEFFVNELKWNENDWLFDGEYPSVKPAANSDFTITIQYTGGVTGSKTIDISDTYTTLAEWYKDGGVPEFVQSGNMRSYGYYFDSGLTHKVPYSYVPVGDVTLYAGFADYSLVAGVYGVQTPDPGNGATVTITLGVDGTLVYRHGANNLTSYYTYDGNKILLLETVLGKHAYGNRYAADAFEATPVEGANGIYNVYDLTMQKNNDGFVAVKQIEGFAYGEYYSDGTSYVFYTDGTGIVTSGGTTQSFMYVFTDSKIRIIDESGAEFDATVSNGVITVIDSTAVTKSDVFAGIWEKSANSHRKYTFDGRGGWSYKYVGYDGNGDEIPVDSASGTYTVSGNTATLSDGKTAVITEDGFLRVDDETFYVDNSYTGTWAFNSSNITEITFEGIGNKGYGNAVVNYGSSYDKYKVTYEVAPDGSVSIYNRDYMFGQLNYSAGDKTLSGSLYSAPAGGVRGGVTFFLYDYFKGNWVSGDEDFFEVEFNGLGNYNVAGTEYHLAARGNVNINGADAGLYAVTNGTLDGTFTYGGVDYTIAYNENNNTVSVAGGGKNVTLMLRDARYGNDFADKTGAVYTFDGRGDLAEGGTMTVTSGSESTEYTYKNAPDGSVTLTKGGESGSITVDAANNCYVFSFGSIGVNLYIQNSFGGEWFVGKTDGGKIEIGDIGADSTAAGKYLGQNVVYVYNAETKELTFAQGGVTYAVTVLSGGESPELRITDDSGSRICVRTRDEYAGRYVSENATLILDGLNDSYYGIGTVIIAEDGDETYLSYGIDEFGNIVFRNSGVLESVLTPDENGEYVNGTNRYKLTEPDPLYGSTVYAKKGNEADYSKQYIFDGVSTVYDSSYNVLYTYVFEEITNDDDLKLQWRLVFTDTSGTKYNAIVNHSSTDYTIEILEILD